MCEARLDGQHTIGLEEKQYVETAIGTLLLLQFLKVNNRNQNCSSLLPHTKNVIIY